MLTDYDYCGWLQTGVGIKYVICSHRTYDRDKINLFQTHYVHPEFAIFTAHKCSMLHVALIVGAQLIALQIPLPLATILLNTLQYNLARMKMGHT